MHVRKDRAGTNRCIQSETTPTFEPCYNQYPECDDPDTQNHRYQIFWLIQSKNETQSPDIATETFIRKNLLHREVVNCFWIDKQKPGFFYHRLSIVFVFFIYRRYRYSIYNSNRNAFASFEFHLYYKIR